MENMSILTFITTFLGSLFKSQRQLALENLALRQQVAMLRQSVKRHRAMAYGWPNPYPLSIPGSTKQPDALDEPGADHPPQTLPPHHPRRLRQPRRVVLEFLPPLHPMLFLHPTIYLPGNFWGIL